MPPQWKKTDIMKSQTYPVHLNGRKIGDASDEGEARALLAEFVTAMFGLSFRDGRTEIAVRDAAHEMFSSVFKSPKLYRTAAVFDFVVELRDAWRMSVR